MSAGTVNSCSKSRVIRDTASPGARSVSANLLATLAVRQQSQRITFQSAAEMLDLFGLQQGGSQYRRLISAFQRVFGATIFFGTDTQREKAMVMHHGRFNFMREARIWYSRNPEQEMLPGGFENEVVLSDEYSWAVAHNRA